MAKLTDKQIIFDNEYQVDLNATRTYNINFYNFNLFKTWNYKYLNKNPKEMIMDSLAVLIGNYDIYRKQSALLILKILIRDKFLKELLDNRELYPVTRNEYRVKKWTQDILSKGSCEICGCKENLEAHHIIKWSDYPQGRIDIMNGMCLCLKCHTQIHKNDVSYHLMKGKVNAKINT